MVTRDSSKRLVIRHNAEGCLVYDIELNCIIREISDYSASMHRSEQLSKLTCRLRTEHLIEFWIYLIGKKISLRRLSDGCLSSYRDFQVEKVLKNSRSIGSLKSAQSTVNSKLVSIYKWIFWLQAQGSLPCQTIGPINCSVTANVVSEGTRRGFNYSPLPLLYRKTGQQSRYRTGLAPSRGQLDKVAGILTERDNEYAGLRDGLVLDIAIETGMRRASINSLLVSFIKRSELEETNRDYFHICPPSQKFNYEEDVEIPVWLGLRIADFIDGPRAALLAKKPNFMQNAAGHIFLSTRDCSPMTDRALSQSVAAAMRAAGLPKGVALHSGRRLFAIERIEKEIDRRLALNLDTSTDSICTAVSLSMGQKNPKSLYPYVARAQSRRGMPTHVRDEV